MTAHVRNLLLVGGLSCLPLAALSNASGLFLFALITFFSILLIVYLEMKETTVYHFWYQGRNKAYHILILTYRILFICSLFLIFIHAQRLFAPLIQFKFTRFAARGGAVIFQQGALCRMIRKKNRPDKLRLAGIALFFSLLVILLFIPDRS